MFLPRFLLAALQIDRICVARTVKKIKSALNSMPRELDDLYRETLERIQKQPGEDSVLGMRVLSWVTHTRRPLSVEELRHGLAIEYDDDEEQPEEFDADNLLSPRSLVDVCAGLVVIDTRSQIIRLVHYTTQEFFDKKRLRLFRDADIDIANACLTYLSYTIFTEFPTEKCVSETLRSHPFLGYAALTWVSHVASSPQGSEETAEALSKAVAYVNDSERILFCSMVLRKLLLRSRSYSRLTETDIGAKIRLLPLECASECGLLELTRFIFTNVEDSKAALDGALQCASSEGHPGVVKYLIESGANVNSLSTDSFNALQKACKGGHLEVAKLLIENGANVNTSDRWMWTPLHHAAHGSHSALVAHLLASGANPHAQSPLGLTACHLAASRGDTETVKLLIDHNFDLKLTTRDKRTVLHSAAEAAEPGYLEVIRLLFTSGCSALAKDKYGHTALDLVPNNSSIQAKGVFSAYMEASFQEQDIAPGMDVTFQESSIPAIAPRGRPGKDHGDQSDSLADYSWDVFKRSIEADADLYFGALPAVNLVEATPPDSPTGSKPIDWPPTPATTSSHIEQDLADGSRTTFSRSATPVNATDSPLPPTAIGSSAKDRAMWGSPGQAIHNDGAHGSASVCLRDVPLVNLIECTPPGSPTSSTIPAPFSKQEMGN